MDKFTYDMFYEIEKPTVILSSVYHKHYGVLENIDFDSFSCNFNMNSAQEISFDVYKYVDEHKCSLWEKLISFRYVYIPQHHEYYKIDVTLDQDDKTVKHITGTSAGEYELSQRKIVAMDVNTGNDMTYYEGRNADGTYYEIKDPENTKVTRLYDPDDTHKSLLHRAIADRAPDWSIGHVDETVRDKERMFSVSNQTIYDFLTNTVANELDLLFKFDSVNRVINVYDLLNICEDCGERGEFTDICPKCGSANIQRGYGNDSHIYISASNYANKITVDGDEGSVKNSFRIIGGDDVMTATVVNCNPAGSEYIYQFSETDLDDMPESLVTKLADYAALYKKYEKGQSKEGSEEMQHGGAFVKLLDFKPNVVTVTFTYNGTTYTVSNKYGEMIGSEYGDIGFLDIGFVFTDLTGISSDEVTYNYSAEYTPYSDLTKAYYNALNEYYYYKTNMMPRNTHKHWEANTSYNEGEDTCYVITLPTYCYLECYEEGVSGSEEFDCTNVIPPDDPLEELIIDESQVGAKDGTVKWKVVRHIISVPNATEALTDITNFVNDNSTILYFEDSVPAGITTNPKTFGSINNYLKDLLATVINPLFKIDITDGGNGEPEDSWATTSYFPNTDPQKIKTGTLTFNVKITNTSDAQDTASTFSDGAWHPLTINCAVADTLTEHQNYMMELVKKRLNQKDNTFTTLYDLSKTKNASFQCSGTTAQTVNCDFHPDYVVVQYVKDDDDYCIIYDNGTSSGDGGTITVGANQQGFTFTPTKADAFCYYTAISDADFVEALKQYSYDMLEGFWKSYDDCRKTLLSNGITDKEAKNFHGINLYAAVYEPYNRRIKWVEAEMERRAQTVKYYYNDSKQPDDDGVIPVGDVIKYDNTLPDGLLQRLNAEMIAIHNILNLKNFLGDDWYVLFHYLRDGEYQNSNIISDGLSENVLVEYGKELLEKGVLELKKATELQYSLSDELNNLLSTEEFAPFKDKFKLGDYIICGIGDVKDNLDIDDHNYKLRLISLSYTYGSPENVSVTFANVTKIKNYFSDTQDILAQAKSMGSSYSAVTHQVDKNTDTTGTVNSWNSDGLKSSLTRIMNNNREEVSYDNSGIIIKEYDYTYDEDKDNAIYGDEQLRLTHNILAFTDDNWQTASLGLGKQEFTYYNEEGVKTTDVGYGLIAKYVDSGFIRGSQFIGGQLYSNEEYTDNGVTKPVSHMNWDEGTFELARGNLRYYKDGQNNYKLYINADMDIHGDLTVLDTSNRVLFHANTNDHQVSIGGFSVNNNAIYNGVSSLSNPSDGIYLGYDGILSQKTVNNNRKYVKIQDGKVEGNDVDISGKITATDGKIGKWTINNDGLIYNAGQTDESGITPDGLSVVGTKTNNKQYFMRFYPNSGEILNIGAEIYSGNTHQYTDKYLVIDNFGAIYCNDILVGDVDPQAGDQISVYNTIKNIGTTEFQKSTATVAKNPGYTSVGNITLDAGTWVLTGRVEFAENATGQRAICWSKTNSGNDGTSGLTKGNASGDGVTGLCNSTVITLTASTTIYLLGWQNAVANGLSCTYWINAVCIK